MPKLKINEVNGAPVVSSVWLENSAQLFPGETVDIEDVGPFQNLLDRNVLVVSAGRPKGKSGAAAAHTDQD